MHLLCDENMPRTVVQALRERGHDVLYVRETMRGATDEVVLAAAQADSRLVVTQDKDFGELAFRFGLPAACGILLLRLTGDDPAADVRRMVDVVESIVDWTGQFVVVTDDHIRVRPLPPTK
jgi:predicted nuclease of predicted toxin-antitoxin system